MTGQTSHYVGGASGGDGASSIVAAAAKLATLQPGGPDVNPAANVFGTWAELVAWANVVPGFKIITLDDRYGAVVASSSFDGKKLVQFQGITDGNEPTVELSIDAGVTLTDCSHFGPMLAVVGNAGVADPAPLVYTPAAAPSMQTIVLLDRNTTFRNDGVRAMVDVTGGAFFIFALYGGNFDPGTGAILDVDVTSSAFVIALVSSDVGADVVTGSGFVVVLYNDLSASNGIFGQSAFTGTIIFIPPVGVSGSAAISGGAITLDAGLNNFAVLELSAEGGVADDLDTITVPFPSYDRLFLVLRWDGAAPVTVRNGTGNIGLSGDRCTLDDDEQTLVLMYLESFGAWVEIARANYQRVQGQIWVEPTALAVVANVTDVDAAKGNTFHLILTDDTTISAPTNVEKGATYVFAIQQDDGTGGGFPYTVAWNAVFKFPGGVAPVMSGTADRIDIITAYAYSDTVLICSYQQDYAP